MNAEDNTPKEYNGKQYTKYEALQRQRRLETTMRAERQKINRLMQGGADEDDILAAKVRYNGTSDEYVKFSRAMELPQQRQRVTVDGLGNIGDIKKQKSVNTSGAKTVAKSTESGIIKLERKNVSYERFPASQERIDSLIEQDLRGVKFTSKPKYNPRIRDNGKTTIREYRDGTVKEVIKVEIGKQDKSSAEFLEDTILHEELEARIAVRSKYSGKYKNLYNSNDVVRHKYINKLIKRYFKIKGWNYELV